MDSEGINDDGVEALSKVALEGMSYEQALKTLAESDALAPYFEEDAFVAVSVSSQDQAQEQALIDASEAWLAGVHAVLQASNSMKRLIAMAWVAAGMLQPSN